MNYDDERISRIWQIVTRACFIIAVLLIITIAIAILVQ